MAEIKDTVEDSGPRKKIRWRRHSLSSVHMQSLQSAQTPEKDNTHGSRSSTLNRASYHGSRVEQSSAKSHKFGGSFFKMFRSRSTKNRKLQRASSQEMDAEKPPMLLEHKNNYIRVVATELHPRIQYKTLPITEYTTAYEVVVKLVTKFATKEEDKDPDLFYLNEEQESEQGNYSHMLENNDRVHAIQSRWTDGDKKYSFVLCRRQTPLLQGSFIQPLLARNFAVVLSPSQDSFYNALPGLIMVEEGATPSSQSQTEHLMNTYFQPSVLPNEQRNSNTKCNHLHTSAIAPTSVSTRVGVAEGSRVNDVGNGMKEFTTAGVMPQSPHSALPVSPSELSAKEASTMIEILSGNGCQSVQTGGENRVERSNVDQLHFPQSEHQQSSSELASKDDKGEMNYKQLMQRSISQGMPGIMSKVINESKRSVVPTSAQSPTSAELTSLPQTRRITVDSPNEKVLAPPPSHIKPLYYSPEMGNKRDAGKGKHKIASESVTLRTLVCSPMETVSRKFPEFVFTPGTAPSSTSGDSGTNNTERAAGGHGDENQIHGSQTVRSNVTMSTVTVNEGKGQLHYSRDQEKVVDGVKCDTKLNSLAQKLEFDYESDQVKSKSHSKTRICNQNGSKLDDKSTATQGPYAHHCTATRSVLPVTAETILAIPFKYHSRASLYPSFLRSAYYSTEMDIMESLHTLLDMKFKQQHPNVQEAQHSAQGIRGNRPIPTTESLMDEARKSHLIFSKETPKKANTSLKRPHSFHYRRTRSEISAESSNLESPVKREFLMRKAAEATKKRKKVSISEKESDLDALLEQLKGKPGHVGVTAKVHTIEESSHQVQESSNNYARSMENLTMTNTTLPESSSCSQKLLSSSSYTPHALPTRHASFRESSSGRTSMSQRSALPRRSKSFHESSKNSQSLEALHIKSGLLREEGDEELLYTFERKRRPVTVLVRSNSSLSVHNSQTAGAKLVSPRAKNHPSSNLMTMKAISSQGLALSEITENQSSTRSMFEGAGSLKRFSRNRPKSAPTERPSHSRGTDSGRESSGVEGLMSSIHLKADKLWWNEL